MRKQLLFCLILSQNLFAGSIGALLFHGNCVTCHNETKSISAPSMAEVRKRYKKAFGNKKEFIAYMSSWVLQPNTQGSIMQDMIDKYELMPQLAFEKEVLEEISAYIYETDFSQKHAEH